MTSKYASASIRAEMPHTFVNMKSVKTNDQ